MNIEKQLHDYLGIDNINKTIKNIYHIAREGK